MSRTGFEIDPGAIADDIADALCKTEAFASIHYELYTRPDYHKMRMITDPVDRAVVVVVASREQAAAVYAAAEKILAEGRTT